MCKAFDMIESRQILNIFYPKIPIFLHACEACYELPSNVSTMMPIVIEAAKYIEKL